MGWPLASFFVMEGVAASTVHWRSERRAPRSLRLLMRPRHLLIVATLAAAAAFVDAPQAARSEVGGPSVSDSARAELAVGRFWHAARILRAEGAAEGTTEEVVMLARAEAGWHNWSGVLEVLEGRVWIAEEPDILYLLARAYEETGSWESAADVYGSFVRMTAGAASTSAASEPAARARLARVAYLANRPNEALSTLASLQPFPVLRSWIAVALADHAATDGDVAGVLALRAHAVAPETVRALWRTEADARLASGDSVGAEALFRRAYTELDDSRRFEAGLEAARLALARDGSVGALPMLWDVFERGSTSVRSGAAVALVDAGDHDLDRTLALARSLDRAGEGARALRAYDRANDLVGASGGRLAARDRLERARLMSTVRARQAEALEEFRTIRDSGPEAAVGARNLEVWAGMRRRQGLTAQVATLRRWLIEEYRSSGQAIEVVWTQGTDAEARGALDRALERYRFIAEAAHTHTRAGQARMRTGQIHLRRGDPASAAQVFEAYLADFPSGRRWQEASYWAGRTRLELGDSVAAQRHLRRVLQEPVDYYAVMAADLLDVPFDVDVPAGLPSEEPGWLSEGLERLDLLDEAGVEAGVQSEIRRLQQRAGARRGPRLRLAEALIERGRTIDGINLGWALLEDEGSWDQELLKVTYPFPYRDLVRREAEEWGIDPIMMAAIIRQESAFKADIVSHAGAVGLMQVMPPTGAQLARAHGPDEFSEAVLRSPEVNLHLGSAFFVEMSRRYDGDLPLVLSAYNAGPTRATRWRRYPEARDPLRFTERIPFVETRGYVKNVRRNVGLYRALYGQD